MLQRKERSIGRRQPAIVLYLAFLAYFAAMLFLARLAFLFCLHLHSGDQSQTDFLRALYIGFRFDLRWAAILSLPIGLALSVPPLRRLVWKHKRPLKIFYLAVLAAVCLVYFLDAGFYLYQGERINFTIIDLARDVREAVLMIWQSYPMPLLFLAFLALLLFSWWPVSRILRLEIKECRNKKSAALAWVCAFLIFAVAAYGQISSGYFPLRWSQAYFSTDYRLTALGLNPMQNLFDTYKAARDDNFDLEATRAVYRAMAEHLGVGEPDAASLNFARRHAGHDVPGLPKGKKPNIVIIIMESFSWPQSSFGPGGISEHTPYMKELAGESVLFPRFFANSRNTARGVFNIITGIPDVTESTTGTRNQRVADQRVIADQFKGYDKYYMLGGSLNWANIHGIIGSNIDGIKVLEEGYWKAARADFWGVHDYDLFMEAHELLDTLTERPFLAIIQTSSLHKPFSIPDNVPFERKRLSKEVKEAYDFESEAEYNSFRFADYAVHLFFEKAKKSTYYNSTIFFLVGDHGVNRFNVNCSEAYKAANLYPWHVVALIHAPWLLKPAVYEEAASQIDVFPTLAGLAGMEYTNWTLGRDLFSKKVLADGNYAFISGKNNVPLRLIGGGYCAWDNRSGKQHIYHLEKDAVDFKEHEPERFGRMRDLAWAYQTTARYMLYNNKKEVKPHHFWGHANGLAEAARKP